MRQKIYLNLISFPERLKYTHKIQEGSTEAVQSLGPKMHQAHLKCMGQKPGASSVPVPVGRSLKFVQVWAYFKQILAWCSHMSHTTNRVWKLEFGIFFRKKGKSVKAIEVNSLAVFFV